MCAFDLFGEIEANQRNINGKINPLHQQQIRSISTPRIILFHKSLAIDRDSKKKKKHLSVLVALARDAGTTSGMRRLDFKRSRTCTWSDCGRAFHWIYAAPAEKATVTRKHGTINLTEFSWTFADRRLHSSRSCDCDGVPDPPFHPWLCSKQSMFSQCVENRR